MEIKLAAFLITLLVAVSALPYEQKCVPSVYKSDFLGQFGQTSNGQSMVLSMVGTIYFDFNTKKEVAIQTIKGDGFTLNQTYFRDRSKGMAYALDNGTGKCMQYEDKSKPMLPLCNDLPGLVPVGSLQVGDYTLDTYSYDTGIGMETLTMERESFTLLNTVKTMTIQGNGQMVVMQFGNMSTTGIPDSVWRIPASCEN